LQVNGGIGGMGIVLQPAANTDHLETLGELRRWHFIALVPNAVNNGTAIVFLTDWIGDKETVAPALGNGQRRMFDFK